MKKAAAVEMERLDAFWLGFRELLKAYRMEAAVLVLDDGTGRSVTMGWPGCPEDCKTREACMAQSLVLAARHLERAADKLESGTAAVRLEEDVERETGMDSSERIIKVEKKLLN